MNNLIGCVRCGKETPETAFLSVCDQCAHGQKLLDRLWIVIIGGLIGEFIGMYLGRIFLSVQMMYLCTASGLLLSSLLTGQVLVKPLRFLSSLKSLTPNGEELTTSKVNASLKYYVKTRRWIACENIIRIFVAQHEQNGNLTSIFRTTRSLIPGFNHCKNQIRHLMWFITGGILYVFIAHNIESGQSELPQLLEEAVPFLPRLSNLNADAVGIVLWFSLLAFAFSVNLLISGLQIPRKALYWSVAGGLAILALPTLQYAFSKLLEAEFLKNATKASDFINNYLVYYLPEVSLAVVLFAQTGFLRTFWLSVTGARKPQDFATSPPLTLFLCILLITYGLELTLFTHLPESLFFLFLLGVTGTLYQAGSDAKPASWILVPIGGIAASILTVRFHEHWSTPLVVFCGLSISGFLVSPKKSLLQLWAISLLSIVSVGVCQCVRSIWPESSISLMRSLSFWSCIGVWHVCSMLNRFDATLLIRDVAQKFWLRKKLKQTDLRASSLIDTAWYKNQSQIYASVSSDNDIGLPKKEGTKQWKNS